MYDMLKNMDPPLGFGQKCPNRLAYKKLIRMNMPVDIDGKVNFTTTLFALIRENLNIKMRSAEEMDQADMELRETIRHIWPLQAKKMIDLLVPPNDQLSTGKLSVGKIYAGFLILESWRSTRFGQLETNALQKPSIFDTVLDIAVLEKTSGSRTGSLSIDTSHDCVNSQTHLLHQNVDTEHSLSLANLARRSTIRKRSLRTKKDIHDNIRRPSVESTTGDLHLHPAHALGNQRQSPSLRSPLARTPSPRRRHLHHDIGFSDTVSNVVEIVKEEHRRGSWSASTSPARSPSPSRYRIHGGPHPRPNRRYQLQHPSFGTTSLEQRSRSPSPARIQEMRENELYRNEMGGGGSSYPVLITRRGRRLPPTPSKPSSLQIKPTNINFPKLNASPTHTIHSTPHSVHSLPHHRDLYRDHKDFYYRNREFDRGLRYDFRDREYYSRQLDRGYDRDFDREYERMESSLPLSYEQALAMGRSGGRVMASPVQNGYKHKGGFHLRHSDSDEEDWC